MARATAVLPVKIVHLRQKRIVQIGVHAFNPDQIIALSNAGDDHTVVHTRGIEYVLDLPLHEAVHLLNGDDPRDFLPGEV